MSSQPKINVAMQEALKEGTFPGATLGVGNSSKTLFQKCFGLAEKIPVERKLTLKTYFDVASLTKPICTVMIAMVLVEKGKLDLTSPVSQFFSEFKKDPKSQITIRHLLQHTSGLFAWQPYYESFTADYLKGKNLPQVEKELIQKIAKSPLEGEVGGPKNYSDLGFILLGKILEEIGKKPLDQLFSELVAKPLKLNQTFFVRTSSKAKKLPRIAFASTEKSSWRRKILAGEVHDDHAAILDGVAGHAGLFSTIDDLSKIAQEILKIDAGKSKFLKKETFRSFVNPKPPLGFDTPSPQNSQAGEFFSKDTIGHLGFTGCSIWIDLTKKFFVILLSNRVHPHRNNESIKLFRAKIHDLVIKTLKLNR